MREFGVSPLVSSHRLLLNLQAQPSGHCWLGHSPVGITQFSVCKTQWVREILAAKLFCDAVLHEVLLFLQHPAKDRTHFLALPVSLRKYLYSSAKIFLSFCFPKGIHMYLKILFSIECNL